MLFRRLFLQYLRGAFEQQELHLCNGLAALQTPAAFAKHLAPRHGFCRGIPRP